MSDSSFRHVRCLLFDLGDTLWALNMQVYEQEGVARASRRAQALLRKHLTSQQVALLSEEEVLTHLHTRFHAHVRTLMQQDREHEPDLGQAVVLACADLGLPGLPPELGTEIAEALRIQIPGSRMLFEDALSTLETLQARGYTLGVVTNRIHGGPIFLDNLRELGLFTYFDPAHIAISADLGIRKPAEGIFRFALDGLGMTPEETAMIGDSLLADVRGAKRLGMHSVWMPTARLRALARQELSNSQEEPATSLTNADLIAFAIEHYRKVKYLTEPDNTYLQPDLVISSLSELLDTFTGVTA
ncbi:HAD family hydrolase [Ktedonospora formicarum]|uniref:HAD family hydrolase n=1 Tax=Ktedonospora formicarum TaxID=2778364 RepID=A0A8J3MSX8_9CHLR|nr:HAD family hydrolase [Ktedonospora formicarum]GHO43790.1 hypothetical protein KSX_19530 [Ktedonospora formicarum]